MISPVYFAVLGGVEYPSSSAVEPELDAELYRGATHIGWAVFKVYVDDDSPVLTFGRQRDGSNGIWMKLYS